MHSLVTMQPYNFNVALVVIMKTEKKLLLLFVVTTVILYILWFMTDSRTQLPVQANYFEVKRSKSGHEHYPNLDDDKKNLSSSYLMQYQPHHFVIRNGFTLPMSHATLPIHILIRQQWMEDLRKYLYKTNGSSPINIVSSDFKFKDILLNWLISATVKTKPPLRHILVLTLDQPLHRLLVEHDIDSLYIDPKTLIKPLMLTLVSQSGRAAFSIIMIMRFVVMRLMNHWGYDVANYDIDAIILKNPNSIYTKFSNSDLIGSRGKFPKEIMDVFGLTMCVGVFMIKSTPQTELLWKTMSTATLSARYINDQRALNTALNLMDLRHTTTEDKIWVGRNTQGFTVTILPETFICRHECIEKDRKLYVWHNGGRNGDSKIEAAKSKDVWYLRMDWVQVTENSNSTGIKWLVEIKDA